MIRLLGSFLFLKGFLGACSGLLELTLHNPPSYDYPYLPLLIDTFFHPVLLPCIPPRYIFPEFFHGQPIKGKSG